MRVRSKKKKAIVVELSEEEASLVACALSVFYNTELEHLCDLLKGCGADHSELFVSHRSRPVSLYSQVVRRV